MFRSDYFGTGDSAGDTGEGTILRWKTDIRSAAEELKALSGVKRLSIVGLRLGAALAAEASAEGLQVQDLVLWDPVVIGSDYIDELTAMQHHLFPDIKEQSKEKLSDELLGHPFPLDMRSAIENVNLLGQSHYSAERIFIIVSGERAEYLQLREKLASNAIEIHYREVQDAGDWGDIKEYDQALLVNDILHEITAIFSE